MDTTSNIAAFSALVGIFLPPVISYVKKYIGSSSDRRKNVLLSVVVSLVAAILIGIGNGALTQQSLQASQIFVSLLSIVSLANITYQTIWSNTDTKIMKS